MNIILYIGLPKTATTFLQSQIFPLMSDRILYNPDCLTHWIMKMLRQKEHPGGQEIMAFHNEVAALMAEAPTKLLVLVNEHLGYLGANPNPEKGSQRLKLLFPEARIVTCLRYQTDWLLSWYRYYIDIGGCRDVRHFLCWDGRAFRDNCAHDNIIGKCNIREVEVRMNVHGVCWANYLACLFDKYGRDRVTTVWFEDLKKNREGFVKQLCSLLEEPLPPGLKLEKKVNRGRSALTCKLTVWHGTIRDALGIRPRSVSKWSRIVTLLKKNKASLGWRYEPVVGYFVLRYAPWQFFMTLLDRIHYADWDLFAVDGIRKRLDDYYKRDNMRLLEYFDKTEIPEKYLS